MAKEVIGQQAFTTKAEQRMSFKHLRDRIKIDRQHLKDHKQMTTRLKKQLKTVQKKSR